MKRGRIIRAYGLIGAALAALIVLPSIAFSDTEFPFDPKKGDLEAEGPGEKKKKIAAGQNRKKQLCASLYPPPDKTREKRAKYEDWIKKLICDYITADFSTPQIREAYTQNVLGELRKHNAGAWTLPNQAPIVHVVTEEPAYWEKKDKDTSGRVKKIKSHAVRRSLRQPEAAAIGITKKFFVTPKATNIDQADQRLPAAEELIQNILGLAVVSDLIASSPDAISKKQANGRVKGALAAFRTLVLTAAVKVKFKGGKGIAPKPKATNTGADNSPDDKYTPPGPNAGLNILIRRPNPRDKPVNITTIKSKIGITRAIYKTHRLKHDPDSVPVVIEESIEPLYKFKPRIKLTSTIRTWIVIETFFGLPKRRKAQAVVSRTGKSCTEVIAAHERQHIVHHWKPWRTQVVKKIERSLQDLAANFANVKKSGIRLVATQGKLRIKGKKMNVVYLDIVGEFIFPGKNKNGTFVIDAGKKISSEFTNDNLKVLTMQFVKNANALGEKFHKEVQVGLDDDCNPVLEPKKARVKFEKMEQKAKK